MLPHKLTVFSWCVYDIQDISHDSQFHTTYSVTKMWQIEFNFWVLNNKLKEDRAKIWHFTWLHLGTVNINWTIFGKLQKSSDIFGTVRKLTIFFLGNWGNFRGYGYENHIHLTWEKVKVYKRYNCMSRMSLQ